MHVIDLIDAHEGTYRKLREQFDPMFEKLLEDIRSYNPNCDGALLQKAYAFFSSREWNLQFPIDQ